LTSARVITLPLQVRIQHVISATAEQPVIADARHDGFPIRRAGNEERPLPGDRGHLVRQVQNRRRPGRRQAIFAPPALAAEEADRIWSGGVILTMYDAKTDTILYHRPRIKVGAPVLNLTRLTASSCIVSATKRADDGNHCPTHPEAIENDTSPTPELRGPE
jgi:hypothetical protein